MNQDKTRQESDLVRGGQVSDKYRVQKQAIGAFIEEFTEESPRACVILCAAKVDYLLQQMLAKFLLPSVGNNDELLDKERPLGTFSARIHAAYRLGLIDADFAGSLHIFRRLRNSFAHETAGITFDHGPCKDRIQEMVGPLKGFPDQYHDFQKAFFKDKPQVAADFYSAASIMIARLDMTLSSLAAIRPSYPLPFIPEKWRRKMESGSPPLRKP